MITFSYTCKCGHRTHIEHPAAWAEVTFNCKNCARLIIVEYFAHNGVMLPQVRLVLKPRN